VLGHLLLSEVGKMKKQLLSKYSLSLVLLIILTGLISVIPSCGGGGGGGGDGGGTPPPTPVNLGTVPPDIMHAGPISAYGTNFYQFKTTSPGFYTISLTNTQSDLSWGLFSDPWVTSVAWCDKYEMPGMNDEICSVPLSVGTYYLAVDEWDYASGTFTLAVATAKGVAVLNVGSPVPGQVTQNDAKLYTVDVVAGTGYNINITGLSFNAKLTVYNAGNVHSTDNSQSSPKDFNLLTSGTTLYIIVEGSSVAGPMTDFVVTVSPSPIVPDPIVGTGGSIPQGIPTVGFVETRSESFYSTTGLAQGAHTISIVGLTGAADLHVGDCTLYSLPHVIAEAQECKITISGSELYFSVSAGPLNMVGAGYIILVW